MTSSLLDRRVYWTHASVPMSGYLRALHCDAEGWSALVEADDGELWSIDATEMSTREPTEAK